jgi:feruloyl-CoA hydratase/lyase
MRYPEPGGHHHAPQCIVADLDEGVLTVTLNRPEHRNAIDVALSLEMERMLQAVHLDPAVRALVLRGAGPGFSAGMDSQDFLDTTRGDETALRAARESADFWRARLLRMLPQPTIAMVHGFCQGGALAVVGSCDIAFAADDAVFSINDADDTAGYSASLVAKSISRVMTPRATRYFALGGQTFDGQEAERNGLVTRSIPADRLEVETYGVARELAAKDPLALRFTKETLQHVGSMSWDAAVNFTAAKFAELKALQAGRPSSRAAAVESFLSGKSKPGLG